MRKLALGALLAGTVVAVVTPANATHTPEPVGPRKCAMNSATEVNAEPGQQVGVLSAGPLAVSSGGVLTCKIVVGANSHSAAPAIPPISEPAANGIAKIDPQQVHYPATAAQDVVVCTSWTATGKLPLYWVGAQAPNLGHWSHNASDPCGVPFSIEPNDPECRIWKSIDNRAGTNIAEIWQDCEEYPPLF